MQLEWDTQRLRERPEPGADDGSDAEERVVNRHNGASDGTLVGRTGHVHRDIAGAHRSTQDDERAKAESRTSRRRRSRVAAAESEIASAVYDSRIVLRAPIVATRCPDAIRPTIDPTAMPTAGVRPRRCSATSARLMVRDARGQARDGDSARREDDEERVPPCADSRGGARPWRSGGYRGRGHCVLRGRGNRIDSIDSIRLSYQAMTAEASDSREKPNLAAVAALAGVSPSTASLAFSGAGPVADRRAHACSRRPRSSTTGARTRGRSHSVAVAPGSSAWSWRSAFATRSATR